MSASTILNVKRGFVRSSEFLATSLALAAALLSLSAFADVESLAETGGYVTTEAQLAFKGITLNDLGTTYVPSAKMSGGWVTADGLPVSFCARTEADGVVRYQAQAVEGSVKAVAIEFTDGEGGVYARANVDQGFYNSDLTYFGKDIYISSSNSAGGIAASAGDGTYGIHNLGLVSVDDLDAICINFNNANDTMVKTYEAVGAGSYAVTGFMWSQMLGTNNNTMNGVRLIDSETSATLDLPSVSVTVTGTRGTYSWSGYNSDKDVRYGYIDENANNPTPTVTISNVPFEFYKVVFYASTDTENARFGYVTVNGKNYTSGNSGMDDAQSYATIEGTDAWGKTRVADCIEGVNYLVTPVIPATADGSVKVVGHKQDGRGCIAAVQIIKATIPEIASTDITAAQINATVPSGESFLRVSAGATITLDEALSASKVKFVSDGTITLSANEQPSAEELAKLDFACVKGSVLRSWLTPGVVGFNFNAEGGRNGGGNEDGAADTSLALEIGTWLKNGHDHTGSSTEMFADGLSTLSWKAGNVYAETSGLTEGTFIQGYLDDGQNVSITLSAVPYETYDLIIYCSTDNSSAGFKAKTVNGTIYTWDATAGEVTTTSDVNAKWGLASQAAGKAVYGANTIRINGLTGPLSILGGTNSNDARGCISAIQIMPAGTSTAPTMTVGTDGEATAAAWTDSTLWEGGFVPSSGTAKIVVAGDVTLTIDDSVSLSAVTVEGSGSLKLVKGDGATVAFDSLSSASVQIVLPDDSISIPTLSAPVKYLYKTETIASTAAGAGNTYTQGAGTSEAAVTIAHNGGSATLTGGTYYLGESMNSTATMVDFVDATAVYSSPLSVGMATYIIEGTSSITTPRIVLSNGGAGRTAVMTLKDTASLTVTGGVDGDTNQGNMFGHYAGPSTFTIQDNAIFTCTNYEILVGRTANTQTININGGVFTTKGIMVSGQYQGTYALNMNGGVLALGSLGIGTYHAGWTIPVTVSGENEIRATAETLPIGPAVTLAQGSSLAFTKVDGVETSTVTLASISGTGSISVGAGVTLNLGTNRPEGQITVDEDGVLAIVMADKSDVPVLHVTAQPATVKLYAVDGVTEYADATVEYDSEAGTITVKAPRPIWNATTDSAFDTVGNWSSGDLPGNGQDATVNFASDTDMTVAGTYTLGDLAFTGSGNATVSGEGSIAAASYDFSATTGRIEYNLPTGSGSVAAGADTVLTQNGSGEIVIAPDTKLTLAAPWGTVDGSVATFDGGFAPKERSVLTIAPGEGMIQKTTQPVLYQYQLTTIAISNGTFLVDFNGGGTGYFAGNSIRIDDGGILSLERVTDLTGYSVTAAPLTINEGGTLQVKMRDTLRRPVVLNGGTITVQGEQGNAGEKRALDMHDANTVTVTKDSLIQAIDDGTVANPIIYLRGTGTTFNIDDGMSLVNNVTYQSYQTGTVTVRGTMNNGNGNGSMVMNGFNGNPITFTGLATIGESGKPVMYVLNCEHKNGTYVVNAGSRLMGSGSITGNGGVTLAAANSKICGSLTVNNVTATSGGAYGDQWNAVAAKVVGSFTAGGTQIIENGSLTIGADCVVTNSAEVANTTDASFQIKSNGNLKLEKALTVAGLTVNDGGTITVSAGGGSAATLTVAGTPTYDGAINFVIARNGGGVGKVPLLRTTSAPSLENCTVADADGEKQWVLVVEEKSGIYTVSAESKSGFFIRLR